MSLTAGGSIVFSTYCKPNKLSFCPDVLNAQNIASGRKPLHGFLPTLAQRVPGHKFPGLKLASDGTPSLPDIGVIPPGVTTLELGLHILKD